MCAHVEFDSALAQELSHGLNVAPGHDTPPLEQPEHAVSRRAQQPRTRHTDHSSGTGPHEDPARDRRYAIKLDRGVNGSPWASATGS
jgi:hypothetical protein